MEASRGRPEALARIYEKQLDPLLRPASSEVKKAGVTVLLVCVLCTR